MVPVTTNYDQQRSPDHPAGHARHSHQLRLVDPQRLTPIQQGLEFFPLLERLSVSHQLDNGNIMGIYWYIVITTMMI